MDVEMILCNCASCGMSFAIPAAHQRRLRQCHNVFYCPSGHANHYPAKTDVEVLRERVLSKDLEIIELKAELKKKNRKTRKVAVKVK